MSFLGLGIGLMQNVAATSGGGGPAPTTLNPADKSAAITLSNGNLTATTSGSGPQGVRAARGVSSGKVYWEVTVGTVNDSCIASFADAAAVLSAAFWGTNANADAGGWFAQTLRYNTTTASTSPSNAATTGAVLGFALDKTNNLLWVAYNGSWKNGDPNTATGGLSIAGIGSPVYPAFQGDLGDSATFNFGGSAYAFTVPTGFGKV